MIDSKVFFRRRVSPAKLAATLATALLGLTMVSPLLWMLSSSMKIEADVFHFPVQWIPRHWNAVENYSEVLFGGHGFLGYYKNSILYAGTTVTLYLLICAMAGYAFAKIPFRGRDKLFLLLLATMMIPPQLIIIPQFILIRYMGLYDTLAAPMLRVLFSSYGAFMLRQFMVGIPDSVIESARMDGAGQGTIFTRIVFAMSKPALATLGILKFVWSWNDYQGPLIFLSSASKYTLQLGIATFVSSDDGMGQVYSLVMAAAVLAIVPLFLIFLFFQRQVVDGMAAGAVKG